MGEDSTYIMPNLKDLALVLEILPEIEETTLTGVPRHILECFHKVMEPLYADETPFNYETLTTKYNEVFRRKRSSSTLRDYVKLLREIGYVDTIRNPTDKRFRLITIIKEKDKSLSECVVEAFTDSFHLDNLESWFNDTKKYVGKTRVFIKQKITEDHETSLEKIYKDHYSPTLIPTYFDFSQTHYFRDVKPIQKAKPQTKLLDTAPTQSDIILPSINIASVLQVVALDPVTHGNCPICKKRDVNLIWQVQIMDGTRYDAVCMDCGGYLQESLRELKP